MQVTHLVRAVIVAATSTALTGCLVPEKFNASVTVRPDGAFTYKYQGTAVHMLAAMEIKKSGSLSAKAESQLKADAEKAAKAPGVKKLTYQGSGRYEVSVDRDLKVGQRSEVLIIVSLTKSKDGVYTLSASQLKEKERAELMGLGITVDGTVEVTLPANAKVLTQNARSTPGLFSKSYSWKVNGYDAKPAMTFTLN